MKTTQNSFVFFNQAGCLLPLLLIFNLFFGWVFLRTLHWLILEAVLLLLFLLSGYSFTRRVISGSYRGRRPGAIDAEGEIVPEDKEGDRKKLK